MLTALAMTKWFLTLQWNADRGSKKKTQPAYGVCRAIKPPHSTAILAPREGVKTIMSAPSPANAVPARKLIRWKR